MTVNLALHRSVGKGGVNDPADVAVVQLLLNGWLGPRSVALLKIDGLCGPLTQKAIDGFQSDQRCGRDGRVDPHGASLRALGDLAIQQLVDGVQNIAFRPATGGDPPVAVAHSFWRHLASARRLLG